MNFIEVADALLLASYRTNYDNNSKDLSFEKPSKLMSLTQRISSGL